MTSTQLSDYFYPRPSSPCTQIWGIFDPPLPPSARNGRGRHIWRPPKEEKMKTTECIQRTDDDQPRLSGDKANKRGTHAHARTSTNLSLQNPDPGRASLAFWEDSWQRWPRKKVGHVYSGTNGRLAAPLGTHHKTSMEYRGDIHVNTAYKATFISDKPWIHSRTLLSRIKDELIQAPPSSLDMMHI